MKVLIGIDDSRHSLGAVRFVARYLAPPEARKEAREEEKEWTEETEWTEATEATEATEETEEEEEGTEIHLVHALYEPPREPGMGQSRRTPDLRRIPPRVRRMFDRAQKRLEPRRLPVRLRVRRGLPTAILPELAAEDEYDLVVVGAKGRSDVPFLDVGSVALAVLEHVPMSVLMTREREPGRHQRPWQSAVLRVLFATDGSEYSSAAVATFFRLFDAPRLEALAVAVAEVPEPAMLRLMSDSQRQEYTSFMESAADDWLRSLEQQLTRYRVEPSSHRLQGRPAKALVDFAAGHDVDLAVLGSRGTRDTWGPRLGSTALAVAKSSPCSVLIVRSPGPHDSS